MPIHLGLDQRKFAMAIAASLLCAPLVLSQTEFKFAEIPRPTLQPDPFSLRSPLLQARDARIGDMLKRREDFAKPRFDRDNVKGPNGDAQSNGGIAGGGGTWACPNPQHDCCTSGGGGCSNTACCITVCGLDSFCCNVAWDSICIAEGLSDCRPNCTVGECPDSDHTCCTTGAPGCTALDCCESVCAVDSFCCTTAWDRDCIAEAISVCGLSCEFCADADHDCCIHGAPGCNDAACCGAVCAADSFCCIVEWDTICINEAEGYCNIKCGGPCGTAGHGCCQTGALGCDDVACCELFCSHADKFCCSIAWDSVCVAEIMRSYCDELPCLNLPCCSGTCDPSNPHDCSTVGVAGCNEVACCQKICCVDPFCCQTEWDANCVNEASLFCAAPCEVVCPPEGIVEPEKCGGTETNGCDLPPACAGPSNCCIASFGLGCNDAGCSTAVCSSDQFCCNVAWDEICADEACDDPSCDCKPAAIDPVKFECGTTLCGTAWADREMRDVDWYRFDIEISGSVVECALKAEFPAQITIATFDCANPQTIATLSGACPVNLEATLDAGPYWLIIAPVAFYCMPCSGGNNTYLATLTCLEPCVADIVPTGEVDVDDLLALINTWGPCGKACIADSAPPPSGNGVVDVDDLLEIIDHWGPCV